eukprot:12300.XXX_577684_576342_1 [CDS] Oithona nana genome sequencing.
MKIPIEKAVTPPSSWFTTQLFHELDKKAVFQREWICVGRAEQVNENGKFFAGCVASEPFIVVNDNSDVKAFFNVCRHHAAQLTPDGAQGCTDKFECPYHGWTYSTSGRLTKAKRLKGIQDFSAKNFSLIPISVQQWGPFIFINLSSKNDRIVSTDFAEVRTSMENEVGPFDHGMKFVKRVVYDVESNWKVFVDNYLDGGYHVSVLHKDLTAGLDIDSYKTEVQERYSMQKVQGKENEQADRLGKSSVYAYLYPNMMINRYGPWMDTNVVIPKTPTSCQVIYDYFLEEAKWNSFDKENERQEYITNCLKNSDQVQQEDGFICQAVQKGLESSGYDVGRYAPNVEMADHQFHLQLCHNYDEFLNTQQ